MQNSPKFSNVILAQNITIVKKKKSNYLFFPLHTHQAVLDNSISCWVHSSSLKNIDKMFEGSLTSFRSMYASEVARRIVGVLNKSKGTGGCDPGP